MRGSAPGMTGLLVNLFREVEIRLRLAGLRRAHALGEGERADVLRDARPHVLDGGPKALKGNHELLVGLQQEVHEEAAGVGMRRALQERRSERDIGKAL